MPSFRSPTTLQDGKAAPVKTASRVPAASGTKEEAALQSTADTSGGKGRMEAGASSSGRIQGGHAEEAAQLQQFASQEAGRGTGSHERLTTSMTPEELLPLIYVTWEMETVQMIIPSWSSLQQAAQQARQGVAIETGAARRCRETGAMRRACADAVAKNAKPSADAWKFATPRLAASVLYTKTVRAWVEPFMLNPSKEQEDGCHAPAVARRPENAGCPAGLPNLYKQVALQAASETESWAMSKAGKLGPLTTRSRQSRLLQRLLNDAEDKHKDLQAYIEVLQDAIAYQCDWILCKVAEDCPPSILPQWLDSTCCKPGHTASASHLSFQMAWSAVIGFYEVRAKKTVAIMAGTAGSSQDYAPKWRQLSGSGQQVDVSSRVPGAAFSHLYKTQQGSSPILLLRPHRRGQHSVQQMLTAAAQQQRTLPAFKGLIRLRRHCFERKHLERLLPHARRRKLTRSGRLRERHAVLTKQNHLPLVGGSPGGIEQ